MHTRVHSLQSMQPLLELWTQSPVRGRLVGKQRISTSSRSVEKIQECSPRRLLLVRHIRVPGDRVCALLEEIASGCVVCSAVHQVDLGIAFWGSRCGVNVVTAKVAAVCESVFDRKLCKVLVAECYDFLLRDEER